MASCEIERLPLPESSGHRRHGVTRPRGAVREGSRSSCYERNWLMKHIRVTSKTMPAMAQNGGVAAPKNTIWPLSLIGYTTNDFSFFPFDFIAGWTGINKRIA